MSKKILVAYFSATGQTARLAQTIAHVTGADVFEIKPQVPYTSADLNWNDKTSRSSIEMNDSTSRPQMAHPAENIADYDTVFLGFPIWWYEAPRIIETFLESCDLAGKTVIPFATSGGSGMGKTDSILKGVCGEGIDWREGKRMTSATTKAEVEKWVKQLNI